MVEANIKALIFTIVILVESLVFGEVAVGIVIVIIAKVIEGVVKTEVEIVLLLFLCDLVIQPELIEHIHKVVKTVPFACTHRTTSRIRQNTSLFNNIPHIFPFVSRFIGLTSKNLPVIGSRVNGNGSCTVLLLAEWRQKKKTKDILGEICYNGFIEAVEMGACRR